MSILLGILASVFPNCAFRRIYFGWKGIYTSKMILRYLYFGVIGKYLVMFFLICLFFQWPYLNIRQFCIAILLAEFVRFIYQLIKLRTTIA